MILPVSAVVTFLSEVQTKDREPNTLFGLQCSQSSKYNGFYKSQSALFHLKARGHLSGLHYKLQQYLTDPQTMSMFGLF